MAIPSSGHRRKARSSKLFVSLLLKCFEFRWSWKFDQTNHLDLLLCCYISNHQSPAIRSSFIQINSFSTLRWWPSVSNFHRIDIVHGNLSLPSTIENTTRSTGTLHTSRRAIVWSCESIIRSIFVNERQSLASKFPFGELQLIDMDK